MDGSLEFQDEMPLGSLPTSYFLLPWVPLILQRNRRLESALVACTWGSAKTRSRIQVI